MSQLVDESCAGHLIAVPPVKQSIALPHQPKPPRSGPRGSGGVPPANHTPMFHRDFVRLLAWGPQNMFCVLLAREG
jgi:hypothetical protein